MKTGVLVHGCNLHIENWRHVAWGDPPHQMGRIPRGIAVANQFDAEVIVFGTGASHKPFRFGENRNDNRPLAEAEYSYEYLKLYFDQLEQFSAIGDQISQLNDEEKVEWRDSWLNRIVLDRQSMNTIEEIQNAGEIFSEKGVEQVVLVSSPSHVVRCLRDASTIYPGDERYSAFQNNLFATPSVTCYEGSTAADVVVIEPPHRPDRHVVPTHRRIQRMLTLQRLEHDDLVNLIAEFDDLLQRYEHRFFTKPFE